MTTRALVLPGGGVKGAYQVGALKHWMLEQGTDYPIMCGVSVGALNVASLAEAPLGNPEGAYRTLSDIWGRVKNSKVRKNWFPFGKFSVLWKNEVYNSRPLYDWVTSEVDLDLIRQSGRQVRVGVVSWNSRDYRSVGQDDDDFAKFVYASASFPLFFAPLSHGGDLWSDGGLRNVTPLADALRLGADHVDIIMNRNLDLSSRWESKGKNLLDWIMHLIEIQQDEILLNDLQVAGLKNDLARLKGSYRHVTFRVLKPSVNLTDEPLDFDPKKIAWIRQKGYDDACALD